MTEIRAAYYTPFTPTYLAELLEVRAYVGCTRHHRPIETHCIEVLQL